MFQDVFRFVWGANHNHSTMCIWSTASSCWAISSCRSTTSW
jgi:hypothetical protein